MLDFWTKDYLNLVIFQTAIFIFQPKFRRNAIRQWKIPIITNIENHILFSLITSSHVTIYYGDIITCVYYLIFLYSSLSQMSLSLSSIWRTFSSQQDPSSILLPQKNFHISVAWMFWYSLSLRLLSYILLG